MKMLIKALLLLPLNISYGQDIACIGNSITASGYYVYIDSMLTEYDVYKYAVVGIAVAVDNKQYKNEEIFQKALNHKAEYVVIMLGSNDWKPYFNGDDNWKNYWESEYCYLINEFEKNSTVLVGTITYRINNVDANSAIDGMNSMIIGVANSHNLKVVNFNSALELNTSYFYADGIHPNEDGKKKLAETAYDVLIKIINGDDDEYWEEVEDYEEQRKTGWFGCQK